ncbi:hypothetical protein SacmaDRAFT_1708 [Saccharomonospora marina XMU15]|uniref:YcfA-like protein n=1 Tax=Saccharomonospora marina XMU15 TaxID=882083 RepID=H5X4H6_9PSEU|nr:hypothetical protein [Saccharomonospora marina]EHR49978.1 hypothetical protein SacmaDRAFT_1708 [Saccharomonospora marina XMU15]
MVAKRLKPAKVLSIARRAARKSGHTLERIEGRGKGSHQIYLVRDQHGQELVRFAVTGHNRELSWAVLRSIENALAPLFGEKWMEEK